MEIHDDGKEIKMIPQTHTTEWTWCRLASGTRIPIANLFETYKQQFEETIDVDDLLWKWSTPVVQGPPFKAMCIDVTTGQWWLNDHSSQTSNTDCDVLRLRNLLLLRQKETECLFELVTNLRQRVEMLEINGLKTKRETVIGK